LSVGDDLVKDVLPYVGAILTGISALLGSYATIIARRSKTKTASREETQLALDALSSVLDRYEKDNRRLRIDYDARIDALETKVEVVEKKAEDAVAARNETALEHRDCQRRLAAAEHRLAMLGG
jgi:uncharacterized membrane protein YccC